MRSSGKFTPRECTDICQSERNSIQRKTMHQSCFHGCQQPRVASTALGCRGKTDGKGKHKKHKTEEKVFQDVGVIAHEHCSKTQQVADALVDELAPRGVAVAIESAHFCMVMRGVQKVGAKTVTSCVRGIFKSDPKTRAEFFNPIKD